MKMNVFAIMISLALIFGFFQNCGSDVAFRDAEVIGSLGVCNGISCDLDPLTARPAVTTILMALGDEADSQLVVNGASSQLIAETVVRYTSPKQDPSILVVQDSLQNGESPEDTQYLLNVLLARYRVDFLVEPSAGLELSDIDQYDIVWFNNPGSAMGTEAARDALLAFSGGVVLQGDDLARGRNFSVEALTGLTYVDNGTHVTCSDGVTYHHDNNLDHQFRVRLNPEKIPGAHASTIEFRYGNDIDLTVPSPVQPNLEILASAQGGPAACVEDRPAIVRYIK
jgi:hypothetical protein